LEGRPPPWPKSCEITKQNFKASNGRFLFCLAHIIQDDQSRKTRFIGRFYEALVLKALQAWQKYDKNASLLAVAV